MAWTRVDEVGFRSHATRERLRTHFSRLGFPTFTSSGPRTSTLWSLGRNRILATACCAVYPAFRELFPNQVLPADDLARAMVDVAVRGTEKRQSLVFENRDIRP
jgi:hypothetical protein